MRRFYGNSYVVFVTALIAVLCLVACVYIDRYVPKVIMQYYVQSFHSAESTNGASFEILVRDGTYNAINEESWGGQWYANKSTLREILRAAYRKKLHMSATPVHEYAEYALLMHYAFLYAEQVEDSDMLYLVQTKFDKYYRGEGDRFARVDQAPYGNVALDLYRWTGDEYYLQFAENIYHWLDSIERADGKILYRANCEYQKVDAIGMVCPFLAEFGKRTNNEHSIELAASMMADFIRYGTDAVTGIPVKGYTISEPHIKCEKANWGRGIGWYLLGVESVLNVDTMKFPRVKEYIYDNLQQRVALLKRTLLLDEDGLYQQYYGEGVLPDMSATVPILYFVYSPKGDMNKSDIAKIISPYFDSEGRVRYCSASYTSSSEKIKNMTTTNLWTQGLALYMLGETPDAIHGDE